MMRMWQRNDSMIRALFQSLHRGTGIAVNALSLDSRLRGNDGGRSSCLRGNDVMDVGMNGVGGRTGGDLRAGTDAPRH